MQRCEGVAAQQPAGKRLRLSGLELLLVPLQREAQKRLQRRPVLSCKDVCVPVNSQQQTIGGERLGPVKGLSNNIVWVLVVVTRFQEVISRVSQQSEEIDALVH